MRKGSYHIFTETETIAAAGLREVGVQARVAALGGALALGRARTAQLTRERDRALRRGKAARAAELGGLLLAHERQLGEIGSEREREGMVPAPVSPNEAMLRGRVTEAKRGVKGILLTLHRGDGAEVARAQSDTRGGFELPHAPLDAILLRVTSPSGAHLLDRKDIPAPGPGEACYVEIRLDGIVPMPPPPKGPGPDSRPGHVSVPKLTGATEAEARALLKQAGLTGTRSGEAPALRMAGRVLEQTPPAGSLVTPGSSVAWVVGAAAGASFPDLRGQALRSAVKQVEEMGLTVREVEMVSDPQRAGRVVGQFPEPDSPVGDKDRVLLRVAAGEDKADLSTLSFLFAADPRAPDTGLSEATFRRRLTDGGIGSVKELNALSRAKPDTVGKSLKLGGDSEARLVQRIVADLMARFPKQG